MLKVFHLDNSVPSSVLRDKVNHYYDESISQLKEEEKINTGELFNAYNGDLYQSNPEFIYKDLDYTLKTTPEECITLQVSPRQDGTGLINSGPYYCLYGLEDYMARIYYFFKETDNITGAYADLGIFYQPYVDDSRNDSVFTTSKFWYLKDDDTWGYELFPGSSMKAFAKTTNEGPFDRANVQFNTTHKIKGLCFEFYLTAGFDIDIQRLGFTKGE